MPDALRAAEILLGAGGFGLVLLDVDSVNASARAWPRLARAAERTRSGLLVVAPRRAAGTFAAVGLILSSIGVFSVMSYTVSLQTRDN